MNATLTGQIVSGAGVGQCCEGSFPEGQTVFDLQLTPPCKGFNVETGKATANVQSPAELVALGGIGAGGPVTNAQLFIARSVTPMVYSVTWNNAGTPTTFVTGPIAGLFSYEAQPGSEIQGVSVKGSGTIQYYACGQQ